MTTSEGQPKLQSNSYPAHYTSSEDNDAEFKHNTGTEKNERSGNRRGWAILTGSAVLSAFVAGGIAYGPKVFNKETPEVIFNPAATAPEIPGQEVNQLVTITPENVWNPEISSEMVKDLPIQQRLELMGDALVADRSNVLSIMLDDVLTGDISEEQANILKLGQPLPASKFDYSDQQLASDSDVMVFQSGCQPSRETSLKVLSTAVNPNTTGYVNTERLIDGSGRCLANAKKVIESFEPINNTSFLGVEIGANEQARLMKQQSYNDKGAVENPSYILLKVIESGGNEFTYMEGMWAENDRIVKQAIINQGLTPKVG